MAKGNIKTILFLHIVLVLFSVSSICSKLAAGEPFLGIKFCLYYAGVVFILFVYAICWQQVIKRLPLTLAYANRAAVVVWAMVWGLLIFHERITFWKVLGAVTVIAGIILFVRADSEGSRVEDGEAGSTGSAGTGSDNNTEKEAGK